MTVITKARSLGHQNLRDVLNSIADDLADLKAKYEAHRHSAVGAAGVGTAPSTLAAPAAAVASTIIVTTVREV